MAAKPIDPEELVSLADLAKEFGYTTKHLSRLATGKKFRAWFVAGSWISTREELQKYVRTNPQAGRPPRKKGRQL